MRHPPKNTEKISIKQDAVNAFFRAGSGCDFSFSGPAPCPCGGESCVVNSASFWSILPWSADNAPDRLIFAFSRVYADEDAGEPPVSLPILIISIEYCLVAVVYSIPNHFVTVCRLLRSEPLCHPVSSTPFRTTLSPSCVPADGN